MRAGQPGGQVAEFKAMIAALHAAGLEVILDVVFNHTAEGNERGPALCFRGLDNRRRPTASVNLITVHDGFTLRDAYCQDNEISWYDWACADTDLLAFTKRLIALRARHPVFRRRRFLTGADAKELGWFTPAGPAMTDADWNDASALAVIIYLDGSDSPDRAAGAGHGQHRRPAHRRPPLRYRAPRRASGPAGRIAGRAASMAPFSP